jgi:hypothetical protein
MDSCHNLRPRARRNFIITPYLPDATGTLRPLIPDRCNDLRVDASTPCDLRAHHWRDRKTGPRFALLIVECRTHGAAFTLYPPGQVPYGRCPIVPVDLEGRALRRVDEDGSSEPGLAWDSTIARAALDAARGEPWPRSGDDWTGAAGSWRTQGRYLGQLAEIFGLIAAREQPLVGPLGVSALGHREAAATYLGAKGYQARGRAVWIIVDELQDARCDLLDLILAGGFAAGRWGQPRRWDVRTGQQRIVVPRARSP